MLLGISPEHIFLLKAYLKDLKGHRLCAPGYDALCAWREIAEVLESACQWPGWKRGKPGMVRVGAVPRLKLQDCLNNLLLVSLQKGAMPGLLKQLWSNSSGQPQVPAVGH